MDAPGGRCRAYFARRTSIPANCAGALPPPPALAAADDEVGGGRAAVPLDEGGGRFRDVFAMVNVGFSIL